MGIGHFDWSFRSTPPVQTPSVTVKRPMSSLQDVKDRHSKSVAPSKPFEAPSYSPSTLIHPPTNQRIRHYHTIPRAQFILLFYFNKSASAHRSRSAGRSNVKCPIIEKFTKPSYPTRIVFLILKMTVAIRTPPLNSNSFYTSSLSPREARAGTTMCGAHSPYGASNSWRAWEAIETERGEPGYPRP